MRLSGLVPKAPPARALDIQVGFRAAVAIVVPLIVLAVIGRLDWGAYAAFGAFTALYGRSEPYRLRLRSMSAAALGLVVSIVSGTLIAAFGAPLWVTTIVLVAVTTGGTLAASAFDLLPRGAIFYVFGLLVCAQIPTPVDELGLRLSVALLTTAFALALGMSGWLVRRLTPDRLAGLHRPLSRVPRLSSVARHSRTWLAVAQCGIGALVAGALALALHTGHPYWAVVSAVVVIPSPRGAHTTRRAIERVIGTALGLGTAWLLLSPNPPTWVLILAIGVCQCVTELLVGWFYAAALLFITPLALAVSELGQSTSVGLLLGDRLIETVLGAVIGLVLVLIGRTIVPDRVATAAPSGDPEGAVAGGGAIVGGAASGDPGRASPRRMSGAAEAPDNDDEEEDT
jgi:hypothetical protein